MEAKVLEDDFLRVVREGPEKQFLETLSPLNNESLPCNLVWVGHQQPSLLEIHREVVLAKEAIPNLELGVPVHFKFSRDFYWFFNGKETEISRLEWQHVEHGGAVRAVVKLVRHKHPLPVAFRLEDGVWEDPGNERMEYV